MLEWVRNHQKETFFGLAIFLVLSLFLINQSIKTVMDEAPSTADIQKQPDVELVKPKAKSAGSQSVVVPSQNLPQGNLSASKKPKDPPSKAPEEIIYEPSIKDNVLVQ